MGEARIAAIITEDGLYEAMKPNIDMFDAMFSAGFAQLLLDVYARGYGDGVEAMADLAEREKSIQEFVARSYQETPLDIGDDDPNEGSEDETPSIDPESMKDATDIIAGAAKPKVKKVKKPKKTSWDKELISGIPGVSPRIITVLANNGVNTVGDARRYEYEHADKGGLNYAVRFGGILRGQLIDALTGVGAKLVDD
jgi:hypothetical protein